MARKHRFRKSIRAEWWHYGWSASYFITICTKDRAHHFGEIVNKEMKLSHAGILAYVFWHEITRHASNIELDAFVVMPNHIHGILVLNPSETDNTVVKRHAFSPPKKSKEGSLPNENLHKTIGQQRFQNQGKNTVSSIIGGYKSAVAKYANRLGIEFDWQDRFHDHIIRNEGSYKRIQQYILTNPERWDDDCFF